MCSDAPDTSGMNAAAQANADIAREALAFYKGIYASDIRPAQEKQQALADRLVDDYLDTSATQKQFAADQNAYYKETFQPVERQMVRDTMEYDSDANVKRVSGEAAANVNQQFSNARGQSARLAGRYGLASTAFSGPQGASERAQALGAAGAATGAANAVRDKGIALRAGASNFGRNMPNTASNFYAGSNASNSAAFGTGQTAMNSIGQNAAIVGQGFNTAISGNNSAGSLYGQVAQIEGNCMGAGVEIACCCDLRWASESARFGAPIAKLGFPMAPREAALVARVAGDATAREMLLAAQVLPASVLLQRGFLHQTMPADELPAAVTELAGRMARLAPQAARMNKATLRALAQTQSTTLERLVATAYDYAASAEHREGVSAFMDKRTAQFS